LPVIKHYEEDFIKKIEKATVYSPRLPSVLSQLNKLSLLLSRKDTKYRVFISKNVL
jgi:hypothetical protein